MSSTDIAATTPGSTALTIGAGQDRFNDAQVAALHQLGLDNASPADLDVFFHVAKRTGLDPFARQIHMIGRSVSVPPDRDGGQWTKVVKHTIQTGIDGYRLIARRAADRAGIKYSVSAPTWFDTQGGEHAVWIAPLWGKYPAACRVSVTRDGEEFTAVAMFTEYCQTTGRGDQLRPTAMWEQRPAGQLAKCAEALVLRMAFPQDLSGLYVDAEVDTMEPNPHRVVEEGTGAPVAAPDRLRARMNVVRRGDSATVEDGAPLTITDDGQPPAEAEVVDEPAPAPEPKRSPRRGRPAAPAEEEGPGDEGPGDLVARIRAGFAELGIRGQAANRYVEEVVGREVAPGPTALTPEEAEAVLEAIARDKDGGSR